MTRIEFPLNGQEFCIVYEDNIPRIRVFAKEIFRNCAILKIEEFNICYDEWKPATQCVISKRTLKRLSRYF